MNSALLAVGAVLAAYAVIMTALLHPALSAVLALVGLVAIKQFGQPHE
ncbi:MAG: hypothetical protein R3185_06120 [Candidatus Thermoplasmatota archaeon]|nr:hypothetical protein [Candidatus Thermoplasmatota archaeon]